MDDAIDDAMDGDAGCPILHVDMDAFYASVEVRRHPELRGKPVIVAGKDHAASSAPRPTRPAPSASAAPCPAPAPGAVSQGDLPAGRHARIRRASREVMAVFRDVTPLVEQLSVDEAFLDVAGARRLFGRPAAIAAAIRRRIADEQGLTCSIGVAPNKFLAKLGSTRAKPDG
jgi:DNA polymerase-4